MKLTREEIIEAALNLPEADQVALADAIYLNTKAPWAESLGLSKEWENEIAQRLKDIDEGKVEMLDGEKVMEELQRIADGREQ